MMQQGVFRSVLRIVPLTLLWLVTNTALAGIYDVYKSSEVVPDYSKLSYWAAHPLKHDVSDSIPEFCKTVERHLDADLFFIHPTSYFPDEAGDWNAHPDDRVVNQTTDYRSILFQTTAFNGSCRIFAPRYRQAGMKTFYVRGTPEADAAFELAYLDIREAFLHFLKNENDGRPIVIASHSQGSLHAIRLLQEFFEGQPLASRLVVAYLVGYPIDSEAFSLLSHCELPGQTGCVAGWRTYAKGEYPRNMTAEASYGWGVNPVTWRADTIASIPSEHQGIMMGFESLLPNLVTAQLTGTGGILWVETDAILEERREPLKDYHTYDINLFWMNIRENVRLRIDNFSDLSR